MREEFIQEQTYEIKLKYYKMQLQRNQIAAENAKLEAKAAAEVEAEEKKKAAYTKAYAEANARFEEEELAKNVQEVVILEFYSERCDRNLEKLKEKLKEELMNTLNQN